MPTAFQNGDFVRCDDTLTVPSSTNVTIVGTISVGQFGGPGVVVSNITRHYRCSPDSAYGGTQAGTATVLKEGPASLTLESGLNINNVIRVSGGLLAGGAI